MRLRRRKRVRMHLMEPGPGVELPSIEGLLVSRYGREFHLALPSLVVNEAGKPLELESRLVGIPRERVAWWEYV